MKIKTSTLDKQQWVEVLDIDHVAGWAWVRDDDGGEFEVSTCRLEEIEEMEL